MACPSKCELRNDCYIGMLESFANCLVPGSDFSRRLIRDGGSTNLNYKMHSSLPNVSLSIPCL